MTSTLEFQELTGAPDLPSAIGRDVIDQRAEDERTRAKIVRTALRIAEEAGSWDAVRVHAVAQEAGLTLAEIRRHFSDRDAIAEGFFDMADAALLAAAERYGWSELPVRARIYGAIMAWLGALGPHRRIVRGMLAYKLQPEHIHLQARGVMRISSTVQCIREVAMLPATGHVRELEEAALTSMYLLTFSCWLTDNSYANRRTSFLLNSLLSAADFGTKWLSLGSAGFGAPKIPGA